MNNSPIMQNTHRKDSNCAKNNNENVRMQGNFTSHSFTTETTSCLDNTGLAHDTTKETCNIETPADSGGFIQDGFPVSSHCVYEIATNVSNFLNHRPTIGVNYNRERRMVRYYINLIEVLICLVENEMGSRLSLFPMLRSLTTREQRKCWQ